MNIAAALAATALHLLVLMPLPGCHQVLPPPPPLQAKMVADESTRFTPTGQDNLACEDSYRGVGFRNTLFDTVVDVAPNSPAERAGLLIGDNVLNIGIFGGNRYPVGTTLIAKVERLGRELELPMVTGNICIERGHHG